jgi:hypothetical protein
MHEDSDEDIDDLEINSVLSRDPAAVDAENGAHRVHDIQRLERALRTAGMAWGWMMDIINGLQTVEMVERRRIIASWKKGGQEKSVWGLVIKDLGILRIGWIEFERYSLTTTWASPSSSSTFKTQHSTSSPRT